MYLSLNGDVIPNHGYVDIGSTDSTALLCHTNRTATLGPPENPENQHSGGDWFAPDGTRVDGTDVPGFRRKRGRMVVRLLRNTATDPPAEGIYDCVVEDDTLTPQTVYVGLYNSGGGIVRYHEQSSSLIFCDIVTGILSVSADATFLLEPNFMFTLTCISTGGPATTVTWTRDSETVTGTQRSHVENAVTAQYRHTLSLQYNHTLIETRRLEGVYKCSTANAVSSASSPELRLYGI